ncbi:MULTISPECIES: cell wall metabolism sensor histidine kinase WalK [Micromonospora]|uniref:Signal transduction histidine-protein kinase/phosphatase MprB n=1 Tax=Micromonospora solifontis TaxID=2487138 RepID=A0ABX9WHU0_9ACTN|nr:MULTISPECIES: HAMP domain-containing sensor histidine kinase [Micromonospora]NES13165.1 HAMP domain-containing histidine kinase [Micromonospora sp. PPF5-17B]NES36270.1 HAMP domain-containing histidine kinase [Micromonospora solifontis]NES55090.1 HAMP domain-containing histidine kinase [Micromonospora sp. PPF5-6]RNL99677.1 sensor histidine kinase [Micromonospora solifontis]
MTRLGLRARVTAAFAVGALLLAASMALFSYDLIRRSLLDERERTAVRAAYYDAAVVRSGLDTESPDVVAVLRSLDTGSIRRPLLHLPDGWYARTAETGGGAVPLELQQLVRSGNPGVQRIRIDGQPTLLVGVPLSAGVGYYELTSLREVEETFQVVGLALTAVAIMVAGAGAALGWYATRHSVRPLTAVADAAERIAAGDFATRLDPTTDPDLTRLSTSFNHMVDQLVRRIERDRRFAADVSHELRSPLQTLAAAASVLTRRREHHDERTATAAGLVADEVDRFQRLVDDLIQLARTEQPAQRETVDVGVLAREACAARALPEHLVRVPAGTPTEWRVDRRRVEQILLNLLDNAVRYGGGPVAVRLSLVDGSVGTIDVDDDGPGVPDADREIIFDRFVRGRAAHARAGTDGTGLGLALVAQHAAAHGGRATVVDREPKGARFRVQLAEVR